MPAVAEIVCRPFIGRRWAGYNGGAGVRTPVAVSTVPIVHDGRAYGGALRGTPPHRTAVVRGNGTCPARGRELALT